MKKALLFNLLILFAISVFAQTPIQFTKKIPVTGLEEVKDVKVPVQNNKIKFNRVDNKHYTLNFPLLLDDFTGAGAWSPFSAIVFPDTFVTIRWIDSDDTTQFDPQPVGWNSLGSSFDPMSEVMGDAGLEYTGPEQPYSVDTVSFFYFYYRYTDASIVDTLIVQFYDPAHMRPFTYSADQSPALAVAEFTRDPFMGKNAIYEEKIPLTATDTHTMASGVWGIMDVNVNNFSVDDGGPVGFTVIFKPGKAITANDTIPVAKSYQKVSSPQNAFRMGVYADPDPSYQVKEYNNGMIINSQHRYADFTSNFAGMYLPGELWGSTLYPVTMFTINFDADWVGINELNDNISFSKIYPNPVNGTAHVSFNLKKDELITIDLYNSVGQKVNTVVNERYGAGQNNVSFETAGLQPGMYFAKITAGQSNKTTRFFVR